MILQEGRVAAAACFLPLTVNPRLSRELGTRHRAAIGLTEESDAAAIVVSEETGQISIALNGEIERGLIAGRAARAAPQPDRASTRPRGGGRAPDALSTVPSSRAEGAGDCAGGAAVADRRRRASVERSLRVPLEFRNIPSALEIVGNAPDNVDVRVRGSSALLSRLQPARSSPCSISSSARAGSRLFHIRNDEVRAPFGVEVAQVVPATLALELERSTRRTVPVVPALDGEPAPGFVVGRVSSEPATVEIVGPETRVKQITEATTEPVSVDRRANARARRRDRRRSRLVGAARAASDGDRDRRDLAGAGRARAADVPVRWRNLGAGLRAQVSPSVVRVTVRGARDAAERACAATAFAPSWTLPASDRPVQSSGSGRPGRDLRRHVDRTGRSPW